MNRRAFISALAGGLLAAPLAAEAQQPAKVWRIGYLSPGSVSSHGPFFEVFRQTLAKLGYADGRDFVVEYRWAEGKQDRLDSFATELIRLNVDVIMTSGTPAALAAKRASRTVPIVLLGAADPVGAGLVASLARPGTNVTGFSLVAPELAGKRLELLKDLVPKLARVGLLLNPGNPGVGLAAKEVEVAARSLGLQLQHLPVRSPEDFDSAFETAARGRADALLVLEDPLTVVHRKRITELAATRRVPAIYGLRGFSEAGGLMSYAADYADLYRRAAVIVDKILKGAKPADLPVEQPNKFELVINLKTAKALGLTIPQSLLGRADEVIK